MFRVCLRQVTNQVHEWLLDPTAYDLAKHAQALVGSIITGLRIAPPRKRTASPTKAPAAPVKLASARQTAREKIAA